MAEKKRARRGRAEESAASTPADDHEAVSIDEPADVSHLADDHTDAPHPEEVDGKFVSAAAALRPEGVDGESVPEDAAPREESAAQPEQSAGHTVTRRALLDRLFTKSEQISRLSKRNKVLEADLKDAKERWLRSVAEFENYRKRTRKEWDLLRLQSKAEIILEFLNVVDDFERAFAVEESGESSDFVAGFRLIYNNLVQALERAGVQELDALHKPFDPRYHMAVGQIEREGLATGTVAEVVQKGYHLDGTVVRPANVLVAK